MRLSLASRRFRGGNSSPPNPPGEGAGLLFALGNGCKEGSGGGAPPGTDMMGTAGTGVVEGGGALDPGREDFFCTLSGAAAWIGTGAGVGSDSVRAGL